MAQNGIRVLLVDDHPLFREGIKASLTNRPDFEVVGEASDGLEAIAQTAALKPDVILLDVSLPKLNGLEAAKILRQNHPESEILVLTMHNQYEYVERFLSLGVKGYMVKDAPPDEIRTAIQKIFEKQIYVDSRIVLPSPIDQKVAAENLETRSRLATLSEREKEILHLITKLSRNKDIATHLGISVRTVEKHRTQIMKKLKIDNVAGLTRCVLATNVKIP
ncbi:MAG: hypothetical protein A2X86_00760 [Bdellovibrionales bacterium GWA2_49_15]|nr:MAG: hypothetical protein A2X86_00760 [Bdellovibrionales bacterium GWA2_49_15]HAZ14608.1 DNA-binding response regulator [Bdellovibrionales bacterium]